MVSTDIHVSTIWYPCGIGTNNWIQYLSMSWEYNTNVRWQTKTDNGDKIWNYQKKKLTWLISQWQWNLFTKPDRKIQIHTLVELTHADYNVKDETRYKNTSVKELSISWKAEPRIRSQNSYVVSKAWMQN